MCASCAPRPNLPPALPKVVPLGVQTGPRQVGRVRRWLLEGHTQGHEAPYEREAHVHKTKSWWRVMCLTGVDYFSHPRLSAGDRGAGGGAPLAPRDGDPRSPHPLRRVADLPPGGGGEPAR